MPATPARIGFITKAFRKVKSETAAAQTRHGDLARESADPVETFFDDTADAQLVAAARQNLLGGEARRFDVSVNGLDEALALDYVSGTIPRADYVDTERQAELSGPITGLALDFNAQQASLPVWLQNPIGPGEHLYWRLRFPNASFGRTFVAIADVQMRSTVGGADQIGGGTASGSTTQTPGSFAASNATDGSDATVWSSASGSHVDSWWKYQFASPVEIVEVALLAANVLQTATEMPSEVVVEYSDDDTNWTTAWTFNTYGWNPSEQKVYNYLQSGDGDLEAGTGFRYWRLFFPDGSNGGNYLGIGEIEWRETPSGADVTDTGGNINEHLASSTFGGLVVSRAFDNNLTQEWATANGGDNNGWVRTHFTAMFDMLEAVVTSGQTSNERPITIDFQYSADNQNWTTSWSVTPGFVANAETKTFTKP